MEWNIKLKETRKTVLLVHPHPEKQRNSSRNQKDKTWFKNYRDKPKAIETGFVFPPADRYSFPACFCIIHKKTEWFRGTLVYLNFGSFQKLEINVYQTESFPFQMYLKLSNVGAQWIINNNKKMLTNQSGIYAILPWSDLCNNVSALLQLVLNIKEAAQILSEALM